MNAAAQKHNDGCPLAAVHKRLDDLHRQWHQAESVYFDPEAFLVAIQTAIQTSRTVSFILQSNKHVIPDFAAWYGAWQEQFRNIPLMKWMVDARNKIEKQGDLEARSFIKADIVASYLPGGPTIQVPAELSDAPQKLLARVPKDGVGKHIWKDGFLRIQRRWIENTLPDFELLDAVSIAYGHLAQMLSDAHRQIGLAEPETIDETTGERFDAAAMQGRMPCMIGHSDRRTLDIWLATGKPVEFDVEEREIDLKRGPKVVKRYGLKPEEIFTKSSEAVDQLRSLFEAGRKMFLKDGYHITILFLLKGAKPIEVIQLAPEEHGEKYLIMRKVADVAQMKGADGAILLGEAWIAPYDPGVPYRRAADAPNRQEILQGTLVTQDGSPHELSATIRRSMFGKVSLEPTVERSTGVPYIFAPLYQVWGRSVPGAEGTADIV